LALWFPAQEHCRLEHIKALSDIPCCADDVAAGAEGCPGDDPHSPKEKCDLQPAGPGKFEEPHKALGTPATGLAGKCLDADLIYPAGARCAPGPAAGRPPPWFLEQRAAAPARAPTPAA
jgi:hypothetical protein